MVYNVLDKNLKRNADMKIKNVDMLKGNLFRSIISYSIPLMLIALVQTLFNAVDIMVLGAMADTNAVASVGATSMIIHLCVTAFFGLSSGVKIVLAHLLGAKNTEQTQKCVSTSIITAFGFGILLATVGFVLSPLFLRLTNCPAECMEGATLYMRIYIGAAPILLLYNFGSSILQAAGDTQRPLYYMLISGVLNVALNFVLCLVLEQKVAAVAIATVVSQAVGFLLLLRRLFRVDGPCRRQLNKLTFSFAAFKKIMYNGLPISFTSALYSISNLQIQAAINSYGPATIAGNSAMASLEGITNTVASAPWATACTAFIGQNLGAKNKERVLRTAIYTLLLSASLGLVIGVLGSVFSRPLLSLYVHEEAAILAGQTRMMYTLLPYAIACINGILAHIIQAFGHAIFPTVNSICSVLILRIFWMAFVYPINPTLDLLCRCFLVSWCMILVFNITFTCYLYYAEFKKDKIKKMM